MPEIHCRVLEDTIAEPWNWPIYRKFSQEQNISISISITFGNTCSKRKLHCMPCLLITSMWTCSTRPFLPSPLPNTRVVTSLPCVKQKGVFDSGFTGELHFFGGLALPTWTILFSPCISSFSCIDGMDTIPSKHLYDAHLDAAKDPLGLLPSFSTFCFSVASDTTEGNILSLYLPTFASSFYISPHSADHDDCHCHCNVSGTSRSHQVMVYDCYFLA